MKTLQDVPILPTDTLKKIAALAPKSDKKNEYHSKDKAEKSRPRGDTKADLGPVDVKRYLDHYGVQYSIKISENKTLYRLSQCLFDPSHTKNEAAIVQDSHGLITYQCFHQSCNHTWQDARQEISGDDSLAQFCEGYDPNWQPPRKKQDRAGKEDGERPFLTFSDKGRPTFIVSAMADHLEEKFTPIIYEGKDFTRRFYRYHKSGVWKFFPEAAIRKYVRGELGDYANPEHITRAVSLFQDQVFAMPKELEYDPMILNLENGMLDLRTMKLTPHAPEFMSRAQMPVNFNPEAKWLEWEDRLVEIFSDDTEKIPVLQEFFGYCLYPKIIFPCAVFQIGVGGNGKGLVERVCYSMLGKENISHISMARMEKDFGPIEIRDKLLNSCGETETKPLDVTNFKKICSGDEIQAEVKFQGDVVFTPIAKHMISMNDFPGIKDKTDAFFRRIIVIEYNQKFEGGNADPFLADKLIENLDGIFMWALKGLKRILKNKRITVPEAVHDAKYRFRSKINPVLLFVDEECKVYPEAYVSPPKLYRIYKEWIEESKLKPLGKTNFYEQVVLNFPVKRRRPTDGTREVFQGIGISSDPKPGRILSRKI